MIITSMLLEEAGFDHGFGARSTTGAEYPEDIHILMQVHGERIVVLGQGTENSSEDAEGMEIRWADLPSDPFRFDEGDALVTTVPGTAVGVRTADCLPILLADPASGAAASVHCGWRSAALGLAGKGAMALAAVTGSLAAGFLTAMGPAIGPCHYQVGEEVRDAFALSGQDVEAIFARRDGGLYLDLPWACSLQLQQAGVKAENIDDLEECTLCSRELYYSYRGGDAVERMVSFIRARDPVSP